MPSSGREVAPGLDHGVRLFRIQAGRDEVHLRSPLPQAVDVPAELRQDSSSPSPASREPIGNPRLPPQVLEQNQYHGDGARRPALTKLHLVYAGHPGAHRDGETTHAPVENQLLLLETGCGWPRRPSPAPHGNGWPLSSTCGSSGCSPGSASTEFNQCFRSHCQIAMENKVRLVGPHAGRVRVPHFGDRCPAENPLMRPRATPATRRSSTAPASPSAPRWHATRDIASAQPIARSRADPMARRAANPTVPARHPRRTGRERPPPREPPA